MDALRDEEEEGGCIKGSIAERERVVSASSLEILQHMEQQMLNMLSSESALNNCDEDDVRAKQHPCVCCLCDLINYYPCTIIVRRYGNSMHIVICMTMLHV